MADLTPRQAQVLDYIRDHLHDYGSPPTRAEIAYALGFRSANAAEDHLRALSRKGVIEILPGTSRGIRLLGSDQPHIPALPVIGRVAAGNPMLAEQHIEDYLPLDPRLFKPRADYLLRVRGMSMRDAGIFDGDLLAVHLTPQVNNGQIAVVRLDNDVTVKRCFRKGRMLKLMPENPDYDPIIIDTAKREVAIEGRAVGVLRQGGRL